MEKRGVALLGDALENTVAQSNNVFIFPAVGLAAVASGATRVTDKMLAAAARALGQLSPALSDEQAPLLPPVEELRSAAVEIATAIAVAAVSDGVPPTASGDELRTRGVRRSGLRLTPDRSNEGGNRELAHVLVTDPPRHEEYTTACGRRPRDHRPPLTDLRSRWNSTKE